MNARRKTVGHRERRQCARMDVRRATSRAELVEQVCNFVLLVLIAIATEQALTLWMLLGAKP